MTFSCGDSLTYRQETTSSCKHVVTKSCIDSLAYSQVMVISCKHAVRYIDNKLQSCIDLQACNDNMLQTCSGIQWQLVANMQ